MAGTKKATQKHEEEGRPQPLELWAPDHRLIHDDRPVPTIHESTVPGSYSNHTPCGIKYTTAFTTYIEGGWFSTREVLMKETISPAQFCTLLRWSDVSKVYRGLRKGVLPGRQPGGRDTEWEMPIRSVLAFMTANGYLPAEVEAARRQCAEWAKEPARQKAS